MPASKRFNELWEPIVLVYNGQSFIGLLRLFWFCTFDFHCFHYIAKLNVRKNSESI